MSTPEPASVAWQWDEAAPVSQDAASDLPLDNGDRLELGSVANLAVGSGLGMICSAGDGWDAGVTCFKGRHFADEVILWAVRWYLMFPVSYRDLDLMLADRGIGVDHTTTFRWIHAYAADLEKRLRLHLRPCNGSWRVDET
jgi:hypothetical protein